MSPKIILLCTGLGRVHRGFEMYIGSLAKKLSSTKPLNTAVEVWSGGHVAIKGVATKRIWNLHRTGLLSRLFNSHTTFIWEQRSFALGMIPHLFRQKKVTFYLGEYQLYCYLFKIRKVLGLRFGLVLYTGGQAIPGLFDSSLDFVHHVTDAYISNCRHIPSGRQFLLPHFIEDDFVYDAAIQQGIKQKANGKKIVLSVGFVDSSIKRMDLLIKALYPISDKVFPVLLGEPSRETFAIRSLCNEYFGEDGYIIQRVEHAELGNWYSAADVFVLCSSRESFGLAMVEAMYHRLPVICNAFEEARFVLQNMARIVKMNEAEVLTNVVSEEIAEMHNRPDSKYFVMQNYCWPALKEKYLQMFLRVLQGDVVSKQEVILQ